MATDQGNQKMQVEVSKDLLLWLGKYSKQTVKNKQSNDKNAWEDTRSLCVEIVMMLNHLNPDLFEAGSDCLKEYIAKGKS